MLLASGQITEGVADSVNAGVGETLLKILAVLVHALLADLKVSL